MDGEGGNSDSEEDYDQQSDRSNHEVGEDQQEGGELVDTGIYTEVIYEGDKYVLNIGRGGEDDNEDDNEDEDYEEEREEELEEEDLCKGPGRDKDSEQQELLAEFENLELEVLEHEASMEEIQNRAEEEAELEMLERYN